MNWLELQHAVDQVCRDDKPVSGDGFEVYVVGNLVRIDIQTTTMKDLKEQ